MFVKPNENIFCFWHHESSYDSGIIKLDVDNGVCESLTLHYTYLPGTSDYVFLAHFASQSGYFFFSYRSSQGGGYMECHKVTTVGNSATSNFYISFDSTTYGKIVNMSSNNKLGHTLVRSSTTFHIMVIITMIGSVNSFASYRVYPEDISTTNTGNDYTNGSQYTKLTVGDVYGVHVNEVDRNQGKFIIFMSRFHDYEIWYTLFFN